MIIRVPLRGLSARLRVSIASNGIAPLRLNFFPFAPMNRYICAMYFSMTSLATVGFGDIVPRNHAERIYCMVRRNAAGPSRAVPLRSTCRSRPPRAVFVTFCFRAVPRPAAAARGMLRARACTRVVYSRARFAVAVAVACAAAGVSRPTRLGSTRLGHRL